MLVAHYELLHGNTISVQRKYQMHVCMLQLLHRSDIYQFGLYIVFSRFCWFLCKLSFYPCPHIYCIRGLHNLQSFTNCCSLLVLNWYPLQIARNFLVLKWDPHACCGQDMFFYNCYTCNEKLIIVLNKMPSF